MSEAREFGLRALPSVNALLERPRVAKLAERFGRVLARESAQRALDELRERLRRDEDGMEGGLGRDELLARAEALALRRARAASRSTLRRVINATGVVIHTNLGRAPLAPTAARAAARAAQGYLALEYDLDAGTRGSRMVHCEGLLRELTGAEAALVVNNNAAALLLALNTVAEGRAVLVSRGEMIEIGGGFRVHEILAKSGARLVEVGATNKTHPSDYAEAIRRHGSEVGAVLKVHRSNFVQTGFVAEVGLAELARLLREAAPQATPPHAEASAGAGADVRGTGEPGGDGGAEDVAAGGVSKRGGGAVGGGRAALIYDQGSGCLIDLSGWGLPGEPRVTDALAAGANLVAFSGDKLLGGPQAGILVGDREWIQRAKKNPLTRALRVDKLTLAALEATLAFYRSPDRLDRIPVLALLHRSRDELWRAAEELLGRLRGVRGLDAEVVSTEARVGGGSLPGADLPGVGVALRHATWSPQQIEARLRGGSPPVIARVSEDRVILELRSVPTADLSLLARLTRRALNEEGGGADGSTLQR